MITVLFINTSDGLWDVDLGSVVQRTAGLQTPDTGQLKRNHRLRIIDLSHPVPMDQNKGY